MPSVEVEIEDGEDAFRRFADEPRFREVEDLAFFCPFVGPGGEDFEIRIAKGFVTASLYSSSALSAMTTPRE